jgi:hypothetical protein
MTPIDFVMSIEYSCCDAVLLMRLSLEMCSLIFTEGGKGPNDNTAKSCKTNILQNWPPVFRP